jgi:hypothetical protein
MFHTYFFRSRENFSLKMRCAWKKVKVKTQSEISEHVVRLEFRLWMIDKFINSGREIDIQYIS